MNTTNQVLPEITLKAIILSIILVVALASANAYLGLKIGMTISASIPAAVVSMGVLRLFRRSNILENNIVQTAASAGEAIVGGIAYILPAMIIIRFWGSFNYWDTLWISLIGGILGVFFTIPLRRVLLSHPELRFPEGTAIGQVLKASVTGKADLKYLLSGGLVGGLISLFQAGFQILSASLNYWQNVSHRFIYGFTIGFDPALMAAGYIVGPAVAVSTLLGVLLGWVIAIPLLSYFYGVSNPDAATAAMDVWRNHIRYIGVGVMLVGGFWTLLTLVKPIIEGLHASISSVRALRLHGFEHISRTERDIPIHYVIWGALLLCIPLGFLIYHYTIDPSLQFGLNFKIATVIIVILFTLIAGFMFSALGGYFAGLFGSTNSPISALSIAALLLMSLIIIPLWGTKIHFAAGSAQTLAAIALVVMITSVLGAASIANETIQDLKAGQMVGATPWKQEVMLIIGVVVSALVVPLILQLLYDAYGIGGVFPRPGMDPTHMLAAPQAGMMAALVEGAFSANLPWSMLEIGAVIAVIVIIIDHFLRKKGHNISILAVGFGIYLPLDATLSFILGGILAYFAHRKLMQSPYEEETKVNAQHRALTLACGIVAGAALMGVILAIPFAIEQSTDVLKLVPANFTPIANILGLLAPVIILGWIYYAVTRK